MSRAANPLPVVAPAQHLVDAALAAAAVSPCRSKRGVVVFRNGAVIGSGFNGPPQGCPGRAVCAGTCGQRSVHAEVRALRSAANRAMCVCDMLHVELADDGDVVACDGPICWQCSREIVDVGFIAGVWLYEAVGVHLLEQQLATATPITVQVSARWRRYTAEEFHLATLARCGMAS